MQADYKYSFENLDVWQLSRKLVEKVYRLTKRFPSEKLYGLTSQLEGAVISVASNTAEGSARKNKRDQGHFLNSIQFLDGSSVPAYNCC